MASPAENLGDWIDAWSCAGLINVILRDLAKTDVRLLVHSEDDSVIVVGAPRSVLREVAALVR